MFNDENQVDNLETQSEAEEVVEVEETETPEVNWEDKAKALEAEAKKWQAIAKRNEKRDAKEQEPSQNSLSAKDFLALKDADISSDDFDEVQEFAGFKKLSIAEALKHPTLRSILSERQEERRTANATATTRSARGATKASGDDLLRKAERANELPDTAEGMESIFLARRNRQFNIQK